MILRLRTPARLGRRFRVAPALISGAVGLTACSGAQNGPATAESEPPPAAAPQGKRAPCSTDQSCNEDPAVSALWGRCTEMGICECNTGFERSPTSDLCRPVPSR
jgi:hypothetical protein